MEFGLSQDQILLQDSVKKFLTTEAPLDLVRGIAAKEQTDAAVWQGLIDLGIAGLLIPEAQGGVGLGMLDAVVVAEALGYAICPGPYLSSAIMAARYLTEAGASELLPGIAAGTTRVGVAFAAATGARSDTNIEATGTTLSGSSLFALDADAHGYLVATKDKCVYYVEADALARRTLTTIDCTRTICELTFDQSAASLISDDASVLDSALYAGRAIQAADTLGASQCMLDQAVSYSLDRKQFNRAIGSFQAVKHMCAEMASQLEPCRAFVWFAGHAFDDAPDEAGLTACHAKAHLAEVGQFVAKTSTEVHGGMGFTDLVGLHYWFKRVGFNRQLLGSPEAVREEAANLQALCA